jgi:hypothetical protein
VEVELDGTLKDCTAVLGSIIGNRETKINLNSFLETGLCSFRKYSTVDLPPFLRTG